MSARVKGEDVEASILRTLEGSDPERGRKGVTNPDHKKVAMEYLRVRRQIDRVAPRTRRTDVKALVTLSRWLDENRAGVAFAQATREDLLTWAEDLRKPPYTLDKSTAGLYQTSVKPFYKFACHSEEYQRGKQVQRLIPYPKQVEALTGNASTGKRHLPADALLSQEEILRMAEVSPTPRLKALIMTLWDAGVRLHEIIELNVRNYEPDRHGGVLILNVEGEEQKTGTRRIRIVEAAPFLAAHLNAHPLKDHPDAPLFFTEDAKYYAPIVRKAAEERAHRKLASRGGARGKDKPEALTKEDYDLLRLTRSGVDGIVEKIVRNAGITKHAYPHLFRHSRATLFAARGVSEAVLRARFGWSPTSKTPAVYQHLSGSMEDAAILKACGVKIDDETDEEQPFAPKRCLYGHTNEPTARFCAQCGTPLDVEKAASTPSVMGQEMVAALRDPAVAAAMAETLARLWAEREGVAGATPRAGAPLVRA